MSAFAAIFDLNGTIVDTESAYFLAYKEVLAKHGAPFSIEQFTDFWSTRGKNLKDFLEAIERKDLLPTLQDLLKKKDTIFQETIAERVHMMDGVREVLSMLRSHAIPLGLDSSTTRANIERMLTTLDLRSFFRSIAAGDMVLDEGKFGAVKKKSSRLKYLADQLGFPPQKCIVVGDAEKDILGAKEAGMWAIAIPNVYTQANDFSQAGARFTSLRDLAFSTFETLVQ